MSADNGKFIDEHSGEETTGHEWDGIDELKHAHATNGGLALCMSALFGLLSM